MDTKYLQGKYYINGLYYGSSLEILHSENKTQINDDDNEEDQEVIND